ncbi:MAG: hypothetical protein ABIV94_12170 [Acidimicrobiales bacterium]
MPDGTATTDHKDAPPKAVTLKDADLARLRELVASKDFQNLAEHYGPSSAQCCDRLLYFVRAQVGDRTVGSETTDLGDAPSVLQEVIALLQKPANH